MTNTYTPQERRFSLLGLWTTIKILLILGGNFFVLSGALGQTNTWTGSTDNNWNVAANWSLNAVPTTAHHVVIDINANIIFLRIIFINLFRSNEAPTNSDINTTRLMQNMFLN